MSPKLRRRLIVLAALHLGAALLGVIASLWLSRERPGIGNLSLLRMPQMTVLLDRRGERLFSFAEQRRTPVTLDQISPNFVNAILATEDPRFEKHIGVDLKAISRALWATVVSMRWGVQGGSTITQQLARDQFLYPRKTIRRKLQEMMVVTAGDFVTADDGSGIVHMAPAFGADDYAVGQRDGLVFLRPVAADGTFHGTTWPELEGRLVTADETNELIVRRLKEDGRHLRTEQYVHSYPHCWRCRSKLIYYARDSWFVRTSAVKDRLMALNDQVHWHPPEAGAGRFGEWLANNVDWALSRDRYWGTPLPVWVADDDPDHVEVIGSYAELLAPFNGGAFGSSGTLSGTIILTDAQKAYLLAGLTYVNNHTSANPGGEIRGQIAPVLMQASLSGAYKTSPINTPATVLGTFMLVGTQLTYTVTYQGLTGPATAGHIHGPAPPGQNAGVLISLPVPGAAAGTFSGTISLTPAQLAAVIDGQTYVNIHTSASPGGEVRGQIDVAQVTAVPLTAWISGLNERPILVPLSSGGV